MGQIVYNTTIYFIQAEDGGPIKIGRAADPEARLRMLQTGNPYPLRITRTFEGERIDEWRLHRLFGAIRLQGEWFKPHPTLAALADAKPDDSLADIPIVYDDETPGGGPIVFQRQQREAA